MVDKKLNFQVTGMTCGGCERKIIEALAATSGVHQVTADHQQNRVSVACLTDTSTMKLKQTIEGLGFAVGGFETES